MTGVQTCALPISTEHKKGINVGTNINQDKYGLISISKITKEQLEYSLKDRTRLQLIKELNNVVYYKDIDEFLNKYWNKSDIIEI